MPAPGFAFANPHPSSDNFDTLNPKDVYADAGINATPVTEAIPAPWKTPAEISLGDVLGSTAIQQIQAAGQIVFHSLGDSGGIKEPSHQFAVADGMTQQLQGETYATGIPAFCYHLGDVVYFFGQERYYYDQFYDPYRDYDGPIFAIPGNHDGAMFPKEVAKYSLEAFYNNFCSKTPGRDPSAKGFSRTTMTQPGVYFTLNAPIVKIIGLYSNTGESVGVLSGGAAGNAQLDFLNQELKTAAAARATKGSAPFALIIAVHHPPFTVSNEHFPSPGMLAQIDQACQQANIWPDLVLSGHAHLYERYTRTLPPTYTKMPDKNPRQIPYVVAGNGGYLNLSATLTGKGGADPQPGVAGTDGKGNPLTLNVYNNTTYGFLRLTVSPASILLESFGVNETTGKTSTIDTFTVDLGQHIVKGTSVPSLIKPGVAASPTHGRAPKKPSKAKKPKRSKRK
jgi:Calcineurin-like phosphoesterase